jgi:K(+)-stimulated pyrophosphate-energized sodium pump
MLEILIAIGVAMLALVYALILARIISKKPEGSKKMADIASAIREGARAYLGRQYINLAAIGGAVFVLILYFLGVKTALGFLTGALLSALAGYFGMRVATISNVRTSEAAKEGIRPALSIAFNSGSVMGFAIVGLGLLASAGFYAIFRDLNALLGLAFGGSFIAIFSRVGGGIYTKAADVGADIVGKVEEGIPEDDPRNPAVIADNVGDNVGDVAGMGADLYESYVDAIVVSMILGAGLYSNDSGIYLPLLLAGIGILASFIGGIIAKIIKLKPRRSINLAIYSASILMLAGSFALAKYYVQDLNIFYLVAVGVVAGAVIGFVSDYYTSKENAPVKEVVVESESGVANNIISGMAIGMISTIFPVLSVCIAIYIAYTTAGIFGIALAGVGMLSTLGVALAADSFGPVADNAEGIAKMAGLSDEVCHRVEELDAVGNSTAAVGKGFAIGSAVLTALALFAGYSRVAGLSSIDLLNHKVVIGLLLGALLPFVFSALTMKAVGSTAFDMVKEAKRQFRTFAGLREGRILPDYKKCVAISTQAALREMMLPAAIALLSPIVVGALLGAEALGGLLAGSIATGFLLAIFMANAGGIWDNAKKYIEASKARIKNKEEYAASVVGDTVGDPLKDTSGPSLNILIKLVSIVALLTAPIIATGVSLTAEVVICGISIIGVLALIVFKKR